MSSASLIISAAGAGGIAGASLASAARRLSTGDNLRLAHPGLFAVLAAAGCTALAARGYDEIALVVYCGLAVGAVPLVVIDLAEQRLPTRIVAPLYVLLLALIVTDAALRADLSSAVRALAGSATSLVFFLAVALASGQLGAGDVRLAAVLGLVLAWHSWTALLIGTISGLLIAAAIGLVLIVIAGRSRHTRMALGPALIIGALAALLLGAPGLA